MHDFDVGALSLSVPPASAVIQSYRPAVLVRNNGIHDALASGSLRIYGPAGLLIFTTEIYSGTIAPGETGPAQAISYWTPPALGRYMFIAYVNCINDQYEPNNNLAPVFVDVIPGEPTPPTPVAMHAAQHEEGGGDELNIDGLHGRATDAQTPLAHKTSHQVAGSDALDLTGLGGILRDGQPIADHHPSHENGGGDELSVEGLGGVLVNLQPPQVHDNSKHDPNYAAIPHNNSAHDPDYATETALANHLADTTAVHAVATNLEQTNTKGEPDGYAGLDFAGHVPDAQLATIPAEPEADLALTLGSGWSAAKPSGHGPSHQNNGTDELSIAGLSGKAADAQTPDSHKTTHEYGGTDQVDISGLFLTTKGAALSMYGGDPPTDMGSIMVTVPFLHQNQLIRISLHGIMITEVLEAGAWGIYLKTDGATRAQMAIQLAPDHTYKTEIEALLHACSPTQYSGTLKLSALRDDGVLLFRTEAVTTEFYKPITATFCMLSMDLSALPTTHFDRYSFIARTEAPAIP